ncbi:SMI1/KNR4 family protein [Streptomyces sp. TLI_146]|uniref:SMI1/KNR4 family protein n=1 Tax=Streptomyces sp. TLI_146 TaxID=1938858 RepID=UPI00117F6AF2|nr:SMI1/KNR4 family protein [Streptomyces sp. TLI_146]
MNSHVELLTQIVGRPAVPPKEKDWGATFEALGTQLPEDYVDLVRVFGGGRFDGYFWLLEPQCLNQHYDLIRAYAERTEALEMLREDGEEKPDGLDAPGRRLIPWASTENGEFAYWIAAPEVHPNEWGGF